MIFSNNWLRAFNWITDERKMLEGRTKSQNDHFTSFFNLRARFPLGAVAISKKCNLTTIAPYSELEAKDHRTQEQLRLAATEVVTTVENRQIVRSSKRTNLLITRELRKLTQRRPKLSYSSRLKIYSVIKIA